MSSPHPNQQDNDNNTTAAPAPSVPAAAAVAVRQENPNDNNQQRQNATTDTPDSTSRRGRRLQTVRRYEPAERTFRRGQERRNERRRDRRWRPRSTEPPRRVRRRTTQRRPRITEVYEVLSDDETIVETEPHADDISVTSAHSLDSEHVDWLYEQARRAERALSRQRLYERHNIHR